MAIHNNDAILTVKEWNDCYPGAFLPEDVKTLGENYCPTSRTLSVNCGARALDNFSDEQCPPLSATTVATSKMITVDVHESLVGPATLNYVNFWHNHNSFGSSEKVGTSDDWANINESAVRFVSLQYPKTMILDTNLNVIGKSQPGITAGTLGANRAWYISDNIHPSWWKVADDKTIDCVLRYWIVDEENYTQDNPNYGGKVRVMTYGEWFNRIGEIKIYIRNTNDGAPDASEQVPPGYHPAFVYFIPNPYIHSGTSSADVASVIGEWEEGESSSTEATEPTTWSLRRGVSMDETQVSVNTVEELTEESSDFKPKYEVNLYPNGYYEIVEIDYSNDKK